MRNTYITTTLPYVNAEPHIGFALEIVQADAYARSRTLQGDEVFFNTGTDEHGQKIFEKARTEAKEPQAYVDEWAEHFKTLKNTLGLMDTLHFIRTTDTHHMAAAQELWKRCESSGDIYKKNFEGLYCVGCERFLVERDLVDKKCPIHPNLTPEVVQEENYFFRLSKYTDQLHKYVSGNHILPETRKLEALQFIEQGLEDFSISRKTDRMSWGVPVPGDTEHVMYVWFDALTNYISTLGWPEDTGGVFKKFWIDGKTIQMAGKDQVRFQSLMWQAMLFSANIKPTDFVMYHGFMTSGGQKMSKSVGNVISPAELVQEFGIDAVRYFLLRHVHPFEDSDFTRERFVENYNAGLANGLGNLVSRVMKMAGDHLDTPVQVPEQEDFSAYFKLLDAYQFSDACDMVWTEITECDLSIQETQPFKVIKIDPEKGKMLIKELVVKLYRIGCMLEPLMPETSRAIKEAVKTNKKPENLFVRK